MLSKRGFPHYLQIDRMECGLTCLKIIFKHYGKIVPLNKLRKLTNVSKSGTSLLDLSEAAENIGFRTKAINVTLEGLTQIELPCILHWQQKHFVVLYKINKNSYYISDPATGKFKLEERSFLEFWYSNKKIARGLALQLSPMPHFFDLDDAKDQRKRLDWNIFVKYFWTYRRLIYQISLGLLVGTILQLIAPFLTQSVVDIGINSKNINFIYLVLIAQVFLFIGQTAVSFMQSWILLYISTRVNLSILTDFFIKIMRLPMFFFEMKTSGDILQRLNDQQRIENFLTGSTLSTLFSFINLIVFGIVLIVYSTTIFLVFLLSTVVYVGWILIFLSKRKALDQKRFKRGAESQTYSFELINSIQEIKLNNAEKQKRWIWETFQTRLFRLKAEGLALSQYQQAGSMAINQLKNILITFISAKAVVNGEITLGGMMAIQYLVGMVNNPVGQLLGFIQSYQDAKISLERINEIYEEEDEEPIDKLWIHELPNDKKIIFKNVSFRYPGAGNQNVLKNIDLTFAQGHTTAIVGMSGSGKTTLIKLIMRFYKIDVGEIFIGTTKLNNISFKVWRNDCGVVLQDGFIFADTIENNIAVGDDAPDHEKILESIRIANLEEFIEEQPFGLQTVIGIAGKGISQGQRQRILIARAVYKNPHYIILDEATNALDATNERIIIENLRSFFKHKTVIIIAHRLSTVSNADNILVLSHGEIVENGTHKTLTSKKGYYYNLIKNQLELGN